ncbi:MAG: molybdopterin-dependent oxidoreductase [Geminicoccaceae bacterium]
MVRRLWVFLGLAAFLLSTDVHAELPKPAGKILLTVGGLIDETNSGDRAEFDRDMLESIGMVELTTQTPWTEGETRFAGVPVSRLLDLVAIRGAVVRASAANDYQADIPVATLRDAGAVLAMRMNGKDLTLRDKGPLWIVFPWSEQPELDRIEIYNYAVWQLLTLHVR